MEQTQSSDNPATHVEQDEVSLLDILAILAENAKLLIIGPLLVGLSALGIGYMLPQTFESVAVLQAEQATASLTTTADVLDPAATKLGLAKDGSAEEARSGLRQSIKTAVGKNEKLLTLTVSAPTPQQAQIKAYALLEQIYIQSSPKGKVRERLEAQLAEARGRLKNADNVANILLKRLDAPVVSATAGNELSRGYAELLAVIGAAQTQITVLEAQLEVLSEAQLLQKPTLPEKATQSKKALLAIGTTLATGLVLLLFIFIRQALRNTAVDAETAGKVVRIRRALGLK